MTMKGKLALGVSILVAMNAAMGVIGLLYLDGTARVVTVALSLITVLIVLGLWFMTVRAVAEPLEYAVRVAHHVASGDLTTAIQADGSGEFGKLLAGMRRRVDHAAAERIRAFGPEPTAFLGSARVVAGELWSQPGWHVVPT